MDYSTAKGDPFALTKNVFRRVKDGKIHGQGTLIWNDGYYYLGEFKNGTQNGQGTEILANG